MTKRTNINDLHAEWMEKRPGYAEAYRASEPEFQMVKKLIEARLRAKLTQAQLAEKIGTKQAAIARMESGQGNPTVKMISRIAEAAGGEITISLKARKVA